MPTSAFSSVCRVLGIIPDVIEGGTFSGTLVDVEFYDTSIVIMLSGENLAGEPIWSYIELIGQNVARMFGVMRRRENFQPSDFGRVLANGRGLGPPTWVKATMLEKYNMFDVL